MPTSTIKLLLLAAFLLTGCASTFQTTWKDPAAMPLEFKGQMVVATVLVKDRSIRELAENRLAQQIAARGAQGRPMFRLLPEATEGDEKATRAALEAAGAKGVIVMRPIAVDKKIKITESYEDPNYASFWGGYYGYGFALSYSNVSSEPTVRESTVVYVETMVYSLQQNKLVWGGTSKSTNPDNVTKLINELVAAAVSEMQKEGLMRER